MQVNLLLISLFCIANILTTRTCFLTLCLDLKLFLLKFAIKKLKFTLGLSGVLDWHLIKLYLKKKKCPVTECCSKSELKLGLFVNHPSILQTPYPLQSIVSWDAEGYPSDLGHPIDSPVREKHTRQMAKSITELTHRLTHIYACCQFNVSNSTYAACLDCGGNQSTWRKPTQTRKCHTERSPGSAFT